MSTPRLFNSRNRTTSQISLRKRMIRTSSQDKTSDLKRSSTMTSFRPKLQRLIQEGKIEQILNSDPHSKANLFYTNHVNEMEKELASTKKSLSTMVLKSKSKQYSINRIRNDINRFQKEIEVLKQEGSIISKKYGMTNEQLSARKTMIQETVWNEKSYIYTKHRLSQDQNFLKARYELWQSKFDKEHQFYQMLQRKYYEVKQLNKQLQKVTQEARDISKHQTSQKNEFIELLNQQVAEREMLGELKAQKHKREGQINELGSDLIEKEQLQKILQILNTHRVLNQIIKTRSNNLIKKYENVHTAYMHIKSNANLVQPDKILKRMEDHDIEYDSALKRANLLEQQLKILEDKMQESVNNKNSILSKESKPHSLEKGYYQGLEKDKYELLLSQKEKHEQKVVSDQILKKNIETFARRLFEQFHIKQSENSHFFDCLTDLVVKINQQKAK